MKKVLLYDYVMFVLELCKESSDHHCKMYHTICRRCHVGECSHFIIGNVMTSKTSKEIEIQIILSDLVSSILLEEVACGRFMVSSNFGTQDVSNLLHIIIRT